MGHGAQVPFGENVMIVYFVNWLPVKTLNDSCYRLVVMYTDDSGNFMHAEYRFMSTDEITQDKFAEGLEQLGGVIRGRKYPLEKT